MFRRHFIKLSATALASIVQTRFSPLLAGNALLINYPEEAWAQVDDQWVKLTSRSGSGFTYRDIMVTIKTEDNAQAVYIQSPSSALQAVRLKWKYNARPYPKVLGDTWERSYGDLGWKKPAAETQNPWYMLLSDGTDSAGFGVKTGADTLCYWSVTEEHITLTMDTHSGGDGVQLGQRTLHAADIVTTQNTANETPFVMATRFCRMMCAKPRLPKQPVYGINDWYVVYGNNSAKTIAEQTAFMAELAGSSNNRPFSVIDDGWETPDDFSKPNDKFKDMHQVADKIKSLGMRPGLWTRPLIAKHTDQQSWLAPKIPGRGQSGNELILDPTIPETLERIQSNLKLYRQWGYELVKHDYTTYDIFGRWAFQMRDGMTTPGWHFHDRTKTNAEIINHLYRAIRQAAGDMYIIGCNTMSHLSAGVFELDRTGDDTSGKEWARTRKMGVNTLGFRLPQHQTFYAVDGDCVGLTKDVPWDKNRQWLQLLSESGAPLFISAQLDFIGAEQKAAIKEAFTHAAKPQPTGEPLDWMTNQLPAVWKLNGRRVAFNWE